MTPELALDIAQAGMKTALLVAGPLLIIELVVGIIVGLLQAITQVQEQTISFVAKILAVVVTIAIAGNWMLGQLISFTTQLIQSIPDLY